MANLRRRVLALIACSAAILFCSLMLAGAAHASSIPPDPIIDMEGITGCDTGCAVAQLAAATTGSDFMFSFTFPTTNCTSDGVMTCNANETFTNGATAIANMKFVINTFDRSGEQVDISQGIFSAPSPTTNPRAYQVFNQPNGISANYIAPANPSFEIAPNQNFFANFTGVLIPNGGRAVVHMTANVPLPEPASIFLLAASLPAAFLLRRKKQL